MNRILGITAEYDPFHTGHAYQLEQAIRRAQPEAVVCVMSGDFMQRGEPAILDKWTRARIAAEQGIDLVLELPFMYACNRAEKFASGAVDMLVSCGVTHISFGCEAEQPEELRLLAGGQFAKQEEIESMTRDYMKAGYSRAKSAELVSRKLFGDQMTDLMLMPNNILALEYLKRTRWWEEARGVKIQSVPVRRHGSGYRSANPETGFAGGTAIRQMIVSGQDIAAYLSYEREGLNWISLPEAQQRLYRLVRAMILSRSRSELAEIYCVGEGIENRLIKEAIRCESYEEFLSEMVSKRYTAAAIRRIMIYILMNVGEMPVCSPYGRVLAASEAGRALLHELRDGSGDQEAPEIKKAREILGRGPKLTAISGNQQIEGLPDEMREAVLLDQKAADMFHLICDQPLDALSDARQRPWMG